MMPNTQKHNTQIHKKSDSSSSLLRILKIPRALTFCIKFFISKEFDFSKEVTKMNKRKDKHD